jgi:tetratricopeptide (TPR) repeat protein
VLYNDLGYSQEVFADEEGRFQIYSVPRGRFYLRATDRDRGQYSDPLPVDVGRVFSNPQFFSISLRHSDERGATHERYPAGVTASEAAQKVPRRAEKQFERAQSLRAQGNLPAAVDAFDGAIEAFPAYFQALAGRGHAKIALGRVPEAELDFARALEFNGGYEPALRGAGMCEFDKKNYEAAAGYLEKAMLQDPRNASSALFLGIALALMHRPEHARPVLNKALVLDSRGAARAHIHLAYILLNENRKADAVKELDAYIMKVPNAPDAEKFRQLRDQLRTQLDSARNSPESP